MNKVFYTNNSFGIIIKTLLAEDDATLNDLINGNHCREVVKPFTLQDLAEHEDIQFNFFNMHDVVKGLREVNFDGTVYIGVESSPVIYIPFEQVLYENIWDHKERLQHDEINYMKADDGKRYIRLWWD